MIENPWNPGESVVLLPALNPDVSIVHVQKSDPMEISLSRVLRLTNRELVRSSKHTIVTCEEIIDNRQIRADSERTTIPHIYVSAVVSPPLGCPSHVTHRYYDYDGEHISLYQECARAGDKRFDDYLDRFILGCDSFQDYLGKAAGEDRLSALREAMGAYERHQQGGPVRARRLEGITETYDLNELMIIEAARHIADGDVVIVGTGLPMVATTFAFKTHAPNMVVVVESGPLIP